MAHRNIKLEKLLLKLEPDLGLSISNFSCSTYSKVNKLTTKVSTSCYTAPEIKEGKVYDGMKADIFSLGVVLFVLAMGVYPFIDSDKNDLFYGLLIGN